MPITDAHLYQGALGFLQSICCNAMATIYWCVRLIYYETSYAEFGDLDMTVTGDD